MRASTLAAIAALVLVANGTATRPARLPTPAVATAAFGRWLDARYGSVTGYWTCPRAQTSRYGVDCLAEVRAGSTWHQTGASARLNGNRVVFSRVHDTAWRRHWWPFSRHFIVRSRVDLAGTMSVNSPAYDWGFLAQGLDRLRPGTTVNVDAYDGDATGLFTFFRFKCSARTGLVTCTNTLGDAMRYRPS